MKDLIISRHNLIPPNRTDNGVFGRPHGSSMRPWLQLDLRLNHVGKTPCPLIPWELSGDVLDRFGMDQLSMKSDVI